MNTNYRSIILTSVLFFTLTASASAVPGDLDTTFGSGGFVVTTIGGYSVAPGEILTQPDGKIVVCGRIFDDGDNQESFFLARYHPTGALDTSFGTDGKIIGPYYGDLVGYDIALQTDGKIVSVGQGVGIAVHRYHANGTLDASFGAGGVVYTQVGLGGQARSVAIQPDGKIVVVGDHNHDGSEIRGFVVIRYNPDGSLDTSFGGTGVVITSMGSYSNNAYKALLQPDGKIVAVGSVAINNDTASFALVRYNADGSLDSGFGVGGKVIHAVSTGSNYFRDAALQPDGKILATGWINNHPASIVTAVIRYDPKGSIDTSFAQNGIFTPEAMFKIGNSIELQSNGKVVAFGYAENSGFAAARLNSNGTWDTGFGNQGRVITPNYRAVADGAVQPDGKILAVGGGYNSSTIEIVRYLGDPVAPQPVYKPFDFDGDGRSDISVFRPSDRVWYLNQSTAGFSATQFGLSTDRITPADFDGDGKTDISVYRDGTWYWLNSSNQSVEIVQFGIASDIPVPADYTGDGQSELAVYRGGTWWTLDLTNNQIRVVNFGLATDKPVAADYDGDGWVDQAIYRNGEWHINRSTQGYTVLSFGLTSDQPVPADYDGDGKTDVAVYRNGEWHINRSLLGYTLVNFGLSTDVPTPADYDGDGETDVAVYRDGTWYVLKTTGGILIQQFGVANDRPVPAAYVP